VRVEQNAGDGRLQGFEAEAATTPVRGLNFSVGAGFTDFKFTSLLPQMAAPGVKVLSLANKLPFTPKLTALVSASYRIDMGSAGSITPRADLYYASGYFTDIDNTAEIAQGKYVTLNARLAYALPSERWEAFVNVTNITNEAVIASGVYGISLGSQIVSYRPPRMVYAGVRFNID
jgi:iron complex outermembrane recepter protein